MAGNGSRGGSSRSTGGTVLDHKREQNVLAAINGSGGDAPYAINNIQRTNRTEASLRAMSQDKVLPQWVRTGLRNSANIKRTNRLIDRANRYVGVEGRYTTPYSFRAAVGRSLRQVNNSAEVAARARDYLRSQRKAATSPRNNIRTSLATKRGRQARLDRFKRQRDAFGFRAALGGIGRRGLSAGNGIRRIWRPAG